VRRCLGYLLFAIGVAIAASLLLLFVPRALAGLGVSGGLAARADVRWWYSQPAIVAGSCVLGWPVARPFFASRTAAEAAALYVLCAVVVAISAPLVTWTTLMALNFV